MTAFALVQTRNRGHLRPQTCQHLSLKMHQMDQYIKHVHRYKFLDKIINNESPHLNTYIIVAVSNNSVSSQVGRYNTSCTFVVCRLKKVSSACVSSELSFYNSSVFALLLVSSLVCHHLKDQLLVTVL